MNNKYFKNHAYFCTSYFASILYYSKIVQFSHIFIEKNEFYVKQTYRNRCQILSANGVLNLSVPIKKMDKPKTIIKDVKIDYSEQWQQKHFKAIESAYNSSPFYEYCIEDFIPIFKKKYVFLLDLNNEIFNIITDYLEEKIIFEYTDSFIEISENRENDFRYKIDTKHEFADDKNFNCTEYKQVFSDRFLFVPNLSILDLLFNKGEQTTWYLQKTYKQ